MTPNLRPSSLRRSSVDRSVTIPRTDELPRVGAIAYAAPVMGAYFFYMPMWSILPAIYAKYFGLTLTSIAATVLLIRLFDGVIDTVVGYLSDWHRAKGGSRMSWVLVGVVGSVIACGYLFHPSGPVTSSYYLGWSLAYFLAFTIAEIPHLTWGSELTRDYQQRARIFGTRNVLGRLGIILFYALPLILNHASHEYTPRILQQAVYVGAALSASGLIFALIAAPRGLAVRKVGKDSWHSFVQCLTHNRPLHLYYAAFGSMGLCYGMWFGLLYFYLDSYLTLGGKIAPMFLGAAVVAAVSTPVWLKVIQKTSKSTAWALGAVLFVTQLGAGWFVTPITAWWIPFVLMIIANVCFCCHDVAALSILGDIVDYGRLKFRKDRGATYFAFNALIFKVGLGLGGGLAIGVAGLLGYSPLHAVNSTRAIFGLKLGFLILPAACACTALVFIVRTPINRHRHRVIQRRIESQLAIGAV
jgi:GPH family glycoside/pentoside/hexuronide:cation symporter